MKKFLGKSLVLVSIVALAIVFGSVMAQGFGANP
jgi:hypothetical protein